MFFLDNKPNINETLLLEEYLIKVDKYSKHKSVLLGKIIYKFY